MRISTLLKLLIAAALPLYAIDDETASAAKEKPEVAESPNAAGGVSSDAQSAGETSAGDASTSTSAADDGPNELAGAAAADPSASGTPSSAENASQSAGTAASAGSSSVTSEGEPRVETKTYADGTTATGVAPLPDLSPAEQDEAGNGQSSLTGSSTVAESPTDIPPNGRHPAHRWIDLAEVKIAALEAAVGAELFDILRNLRQEL
jgi:hypothetical protein